MCGPKDKIMCSLVFYKYYPKKQCFGSRIENSAFVYKYLWKPFLLGISLLILWLVWIHVYQSFYKHRESSALVRVEMRFFSVKQVSL